MDHPIITAEEFKTGQILLFDKPLNWTSFQLVNKVRWMIRKSCDIKKIKVGHAGTLDPLATGLLIICTGKFTKRIPELQGQIKEYTGTFCLGSTTASYDLETEIDETFPIDHITEENIAETTKSFIGDIEQLPPVFSALKKDGKRLYEYARKGEEVEIKPRTISIEAFETDASDFPDINFRVVCSKGTYIRSLAHDFGKKLNSGAHLSSLRRTKIGDFSIENSLGLDDFEKQLPRPVSGA
ncbi:tRNA pseudouridine synthase B [Zunongwangia profunda SM-A87]|uniref:tRNA pseudouridine synthase B n=1 Tax=Zunongwangia profunda (strain DSM 18752 / CCTCC AB 206139 / SM-A87) TaxID=655815 RepID=D5BCB7_ZUNPS|nr:tRNA pseudouridine(55) synthase TruB [Zunongwangia profunda]ADF54743.1 tRNA pseudouridine synthase B [Zunongwangia profunda SM-A87]|tara:strand:+ start:2522 stop:3241 length:720 start_codon:yes stop_codon:yes gene_type:complete